MYDDLERALVKIPGLYEKNQRYAYNKFEDKKLNQQLEFWIELKAGLNDASTNVAKLNEQIIKALCHINQDFKSQIEHVKTNKDAHMPLPCTFIYKHGASPMVEQSAQHKNKYVYNNRR